MRFRPAHQSMINRRFNDRASCPARKSPKQALVRKPRIHSPASGKGGHESGANLTEGNRSAKPKSRRGIERAPPFWGLPLLARRWLRPELKKCVGDLEPGGFEVNKDVRARAETRIII